MELGLQKPMLLNQVKNESAVNVQTLADLVKRYDDLKPGDFKGYIDDALLQELLNVCRDPEEAGLWARIENNGRNTPQEVQAAMSGVDEYIRRFPDGLKIEDARSLRASLPAELNAAMKREEEERERERRRREAEAARLREEEDWNHLERSRYYDLQAYKNKYPNSYHLDELDELMWLITKSALDINSVSRYLSDWPAGNHSAEARQVQTEWSAWDEVRRSEDLFRVAGFRDSHPNSPFSSDADILYFRLRDKELGKMRQNPAEYSREKTEDIVTHGIFTRWQLEDEGLISDESWDSMLQDRSLFPDLQEYMIEDPDITAPEGSTDIYLFGTPGTGKTCLLMGLTGATGHGYTLNMKTNGGPYAAALQEYVNAGLTPGSTFGKFVTTISGNVNEEDKNGDIVEHPINLVEMSGEEFALRIADNEEVSLANMGTGATNLLMNDNRKVFFIIVDASKDKVKMEYIEDVKDADGNVIDQRIRKKYLSQLTILNKFVGLFELPENQEIMSRVDAIHFIVTKADMLGDGEERRKSARDLLMTTYLSPVEQLKQYCRRTKRINYTKNPNTCYRPQVFTFSLGKFYLGNVYTFDNSETLQIIDTIRYVTEGVTEETFLDKIKKIFG